MEFYEMYSGDYIFKSDEDNYYKIPVYIEEYPDKPPEKVNGIVDELNSRKARKIIDKESVCKTERDEVPYLIIDTLRSQLNDSEAP